jgi:FKBP-type peptidyl-prolyl cis-trans isomerase (trigger factor)
MATLAQWKEQIKAENPSLTKMVDGESITLTPEEYEKTINEWAQNSYNQQQENDVKENGGASVKYAEFRREAYGSISDQLDMQYHDSVNGTTIWKDHVSAVKAKYPKP